MSSGGLVEPTFNFRCWVQFAKIQNSHVQWGGGGGGWWNQLSTFDTEYKFAKNKKKIFAKNFLSFQAKIGTVLFWTLNTEWFAYTKYRRTTISFKMFSF